MSTLLDALIAAEEYPPLKGDRGPKGDTGDKGDKGDTGYQGLEGPTGPMGPDGPKGDPGPEGPIGKDGKRGPKGDKGDKGDEGPAGKDGAAMGIAGGRSSYNVRGFASGMVIDDEGTKLNSGAVVGEIDFVGSGVSAALVGSKAVVTVTGGSGLPSGGTVGQVVTNTGPGAGDWEDAAGGFDYVQVSDPGAVGAGKTWLVLPDPDIAGINPAGVGLQVRNDADDGWQTVGAIVPMDADHFAQYLADSNGPSVNVLSRYGAKLIASTQWNVIQGWFNEHATARTPEGQMLFRDGKLAIGQDFSVPAPFIASGEDPNAAATTQTFSLQPEGVWTGGTVTLLDAFAPFPLPPIDWDADAAAVEAMLETAFGLPFTVTGGPFPTDAMIVEYDAGDGTNIILAVSSNDLIGTDPFLGISSVEFAYLPPTATDGSLFMASNPPKLYRGVGSAWVEVGSGLPPQWTDGGNGDVTATVDDVTKTALTIQALTGQDTDAPLFRVKGEAGDDLFYVNQEPNGEGATNETILPSGSVKLRLTLDDKAGYGEAQYTVRAFEGYISQDAYLDKSVAANSYTQWKLHQQIAQTRAPVEITDSDSVRRFGVLAGGSPVIAQTVAPADADLDAGEVSFWFDPTNGAASLRVKGKTLDGTVVTATVPLT